MNALTIRPFLVYFMTNTISLLGTWIQKVGLGWLTWQITEFTFWTSFVSIALMAPVGILGPFIAVYAEKLNMRKAFLIIKTFMMIISFVIFFLQWLELHNLATLISTSSTWFFERVSSSDSSSVYFYYRTKSLSG